MKKKICVYTCITGDYDNVNEIDCKESGIDYYLFTNNRKLLSKTWNVIYIEDKKLDNQRLSRKIKILGHPIINDKYDIFVWMDASVIWKKSIKEFVKKYLKDNSFAAFKHSLRNCIYEEANECIRHRKDKKENILKHIEFLKNEKYPKKFGLYEMTVFIKKKDPIVEKTMKIWFDIICNYSKRDQLSFMYAVWKTGLKIDTIRKNVWNNEWITHTKHSYKNEISECRIFYGDSSIENEKYDPKLDNQCLYEKNDSTYTIKDKIPEDTNVIEIEITDSPCIRYSDFKINIPYKQITFYNTIPFKNSNVFYSEKGMVRIDGEFKKGQHFIFSIVLKKLSDMEQYELIDTLSTDLIILSEVHDEINKKMTILNLELSNIKHSFLYRIFIFKERIKSKIKKIISK